MVAYYLDLDLALGVVSDGSDVAGRFAVCRRGVALLAGVITLWVSGGGGEANGGQHDLDGRRTANQQTNHSARRLIEVTYHLQRSHGGIRCRVVQRTLNRYRMMT